MKHFFSSKVRAVLIIAIILAVGLAILSNLTGTDYPGMVVQSIMTPLRAGVTTLQDMAQQYYSYMFNYEALAAENALLKEQLADMQSDARAADALARENDRLRTLLNMLATHDDYKTVDAYVIARSSVEWSSTVTINRGVNAGIEVGMCAITENHELIGLVTEVGPNYAVIKTVMDSSLQISAALASSGHSGMVQGNYTSGRGDVLRMDYLPSSAIIRNNDQVVTAGSTMYPRDLVLGYVVDADFDSTGVAKYALLKPAADIQMLEQVFILTEYNVG